MNTQSKKRNNNLTETVKLRITSEQKEILLSTCHETGIDVSTLIRNIVSKSLSLKSNIVDQYQLNIATKLQLNKFCEIINHIPKLSTKDKENIKQELFSNEF